MKTYRKPTDTELKQSRQRMSEREYRTYLRNVAKGQCWIEEEIPDTSDEVSS